MKIGNYDIHFLYILLVFVPITFALQLALIYIPFLQNFFGTKPLTPRDLAIALVASLVVFVAVETEKWIRRIIKRRQ